MSPCSAPAGRRPPSAPSARVPAYGGKAVGQAHRTFSTSSHPIATMSGGKVSSRLEREGGKMRVMHDRFADAMELPPDILQPNVFPLSWEVRTPKLERSLGGIAARVLGSRQASVGDLSPRPLHLGGARGDRLLVVAALGLRSLRAARLRGGPDQGVRGARRGPRAPRVLLAAARRAQPGAALRDGDRATARRLGRSLRADARSG